MNYRLSAAYRPDLPIRTIGEDLKTIIDIANEKLAMGVHEHKDKYTVAVFARHIQSEVLLQALTKLEYVEVEIGSSWYRVFYRASYDTFKGLILTYRAKAADLIKVMLREVQF